MTPQHANRSQGQVRRAGVESTVEGIEEQNGTTISARSTSALQTSDVDSILDEID